MITNDRLDTMRLLIEGAVSIYEGDGVMLHQLARLNNEPKAEIAYNNIGCALYELRSIIRDMQEQRKADKIWLEGWEQ